MEFENNSVTNVAIVGQVCLDRNILEDGSRFVGAGSPAMFINKILSQFPGTRVDILAQHGADYSPYLQDVNIHPWQPGVPATLVYENDSSGVQRTQKAHNREHANPVPIDGVSRGILEGSDIIFIAPILPNLSPEYCRQIASSTRGKRSLRVLLPQGYSRGFDTEDNVIPRDFVEAEEIMPLIDVVIVSEEDHPNMKALARHWVESTDLVAIVTLGEKGALSITKNGENIHPTQSVPREQIKDTVGCGDTFSAAFAHAYRQTGDITYSVRFANGVAGQRLRYPADGIIIDYNLAQQTAYNSL